MRKSGQLLWGVFGVFLAAASSLGAQGGGVSVSGRVTNEQGTPLPGATVFVPSLNVGAQTNDQGRYSFTIGSARANGETVALTARVIGYTARSASVTLTRGTAITQDFALAANPLRLGEVVVTGAGTSTTRERLTATINTVDSSALRRAAQPQNVVSALAAQAPNVEVRTQSGEPGASASIRIRGASSLSGTNQPLFVVDGEPIDNSTISTVSANGTVTANRASDINPADIQSIEILKSAAAAAIYGARASNGVVLITTKRGHAGATRYAFNTTQEYDKPYLPDLLQTKYAQGSKGVTAVCSGANCVMPTNSWGAAIPSGTPVYDHLNELFDTGLTSDNSLQISGGNDRTTFFVSGGLTAQNGYFKGPNNKYNRFTARLKGTHQVSSSLDIGGNFNFVDDRGKYVQKGSNTSGVMLGALRTPPSYNNQDTYTSTGLQRPYRFPSPTSIAAMNANGYYDNPFFVLDNPGNRSELGRSIANLSGDWTPAGWLTFKESLGGDYYSDWRLQALPLTSANDKFGNVVRADIDNLEIDHNLTATATHSFGDNLDATLTLGQNLNSRRNRQLYDEGDKLIAPTPLAIQNTINRGATNLSGTGETRSLRHIESYFAQAEATMLHQLTVNVGLRNDGFSTFGASQQRHNFPKASAAWTFTNIHGTSQGMGPLSFGKLHFAYGETGKEPPVYGAVTALSATSTFGSGYGDVINTTINGQGGLVTGGTIGNPNLRPERNRETEYGGDFAFFNSRVDLSATAYDKRSSDVIISVPIEPAANGASRAVRNAASLTNKGVELTLNARPITLRNFAWDFGVQYGRNRGDVTGLAGATFIPYNNEGFTGAIGSSTIGFAPGVIRGDDFARCGRGLVIGGVDIDKACGTAPKGALYLAASGLPIQDPTDRVIADPNPKYTMSYTTSVRLGTNLRFSALLDVRKGGEVWDGTRGILDNFGTGKDTYIRDQQGQFGKNFLTDKYPVVAGPGAGVVAFKTPTDWENWFTGNGGGFGPVGAQFIEDGSFAKLRELGVTYTLDQRWLHRVSGFSSADLRVAGRNLHTWTKYKGFDPEANLGGSEFLTQGLDYFINPQVRSFVLSVSLNR